jgi:8-oxo-dGTP diphosphatase
MPANTAVHVAVGVMLDSSGRVLLTRRAPSAHQGGLWEFPGGKVEHGESVLAALARELSEELGVQLEASSPLMTLAHDYGDKQVVLDIHTVTHWLGEPRGVEGQPLAWVMPQALNDYDFPAANAPIVARLQDRDQD